MATIKIWKEATKEIVTNTTNMDKLKEGDVVIIHWIDAEHELGIVSGCTDSKYAVLVQISETNSNFISRRRLEKIGTLI